MQPHLKRIEENKRGNHFPGTDEWEEDRKENICSQRFHLTEWRRRQMRTMFSILSVKFIKCIKLKEERKEIICPQRCHQAAL